MILAAYSAPISARALLRLLQLSSAALPIGAFAYSQGLEQAVALGDVACRKTSQIWLESMLKHAVLALDVPVLSRVHAAMTSGDDATAIYWNAYLYACRGSAELRAEERQVGAALVRLLARQGLAPAASWLEHRNPTLATGFALASSGWQIPLAAAALGYTFAWAEAQVGAATRLVPLGQSEAQLMLSALLERAAQGVDAALALSDTALLSSTPGQLVLSALHETQYSRLFRS